MSKSNAGRPPLYKSKEELESASNGEVLFTGDRLLNKDFESESEMQSFIIDNAKMFCEVVLGDSFVKASSEEPINKKISRSPRGRRIDVIIQGEKNKYLIELKNQRGKHSSRHGIGQLLDYGREKGRDYQLILITASFDENTAQTIEHYRLPIRYMYMSKAQTLEYQRMSEVRHGSA